MEVIGLYTISDILADIDRGCMANNMIETMFSYRIIYFVNEGNKGEKHYIDSQYGGLRKALENIVRNNLTLTNNLVIAETTVLKNGKCVCLQSKSYSFSLDAYFKQISGERQGIRTDLINNFPSNLTESKKKENETNSKLASIAGVKPTLYKMGASAEKKEIGKRIIIIADMQP